MSVQPYWNSGLAIGLPSVDSGHKAVCASFAELDMALLSEEPDLGLILTKLSQVERELSQHYRAEEALMSSLCLPESIAHVALHKGLHRESLTLLTFARDLLERGTSLDTCKNALEQFNDVFFRELLEYDLTLYEFLNKEGQL